MHHHTIQINQPTRCNNFSSLLLNVYVQLKMFRTSSRMPADLTTTKSTATTTFQR